MVDTRALLPNGNDPATHPPATVGPPTATPGNPDGVILEGTIGPPTYRQAPPPAPWDGWPADWPVAWNGAGRVESASDIAWACLDLNAEVLATMPPYLVNPAQGLPAGWLDCPDPDLYTDWTEFAKQMFWDYQTGEAFIVCTARYSNRWPARFHVVAPWLVNAELGGDGRRLYTIGGEPVPDGDLLHLRYQSRTDDAHGHGPLEVGQARVVAANVLARYATNLAATGGIPSSILTHPAELVAGQADTLRDQWLEARMSTLGLPAVLSGGVTWQPTQLNPNDMALLPLSQSFESRIAVLLGTPPYLVGLPSGGDPMTYSNAEGIYDYHWRRGLRPKAERVMRALSRWVLPYGTRVELNRDAYVQPGPLERAQTYQILAGIEQDGATAITVDEIRLAERYDAPASTTDPGVLR